MLWLSLFFGEERLLHVLVDFVVALEQHLELLSPLLHAYFSVSVPFPTLQELLVGLCRDVVAD